MKDLIMFIKAFSLDPQLDERIKEHKKHLELHYILSHLVCNKRCLTESNKKKISEFFKAARNCIPGGDIRDLGTLYGMDMISYTSNNRSSMTMDLFILYYVAYVLSEVDMGTPILEKCLFEGNVGATSSRRDDYAFGETDESTMLRPLQAWIDLSLNSCFVSMCELGSTMFQPIYSSTVANDNMARNPDINFFHKKGKAVLEELHLQQQLAALAQTTQQQDSVALQDGNEQGGNDISQTTQQQDSVELQDGNDQGGNDQGGNGQVELNEDESVYRPSQLTQQQDGVGDNVALSRPALSHDNDGTKDVAMSEPPQQQTDGMEVNTLEDFLVPEEELPEIDFNEFIIENSKRDDDNDDGTKDVAMSEPPQQQTANQVDAHGGRGKRVRFETNVVPTQPIQELDVAIRMETIANGIEDDDDDGVSIHLQHIIKQLLWSVVQMSESGNMRDRVMILNAKSLIEELEEMVIGNGASTSTCLFAVYFNVYILLIMSF